MSNEDVPSYDELPVITTLGLPHAWDFFGRDDERGALNFLTAEAVRGGVAEVRQGVSLSLSLPMRSPEPPLFGREPFTHRVFPIDRNTWDESLDGYNPQSSSQWDGFRHVRLREFGFFGGRTEDPSPDTAWLGIDRWAATGIVGRGVLADVEGHLARTGASVPVDEEFAITTDLLADTLATQGTELRRGDILLVRTGWPAKYAAKGDPHPASIPGIHAGEQTARYLWNHGVSAVVADLPAIEPVPGDPAVGSLHRRLLAALGIPLGELFDLEELARACHERASHAFLFTAAPLNLRGGVGSPANALAVL
jgi:kynurenine formamidase